jgi:hypothetical protein
MSNSEFVKHADDSNFSTLVLKEEKPDPGGFLGVLVRPLQGNRPNS